MSTAARRSQRLTLAAICAAMLVPGLPVGAQRTTKVERVDASTVYTKVENALKKTGVTICGSVRYGENAGYGYRESRRYDISKGPCPSERPPVEGNQRFSSLSVDVYDNAASLQRGLSIHRDEVVNGRPFSGAAWILGQAIVNLGHYVHPTMANMVERAMQSVAAQKQYFRFGVITANPSGQTTDKSLEAAAIRYCREQALTWLKYSQSVEWSDLAKEESSGQWLVAGVRTAKSPTSGNVLQNYSCRVQKGDRGWRLRMIQVFKESSKTGRDVFQVWKE